MNQIKRITTKLKGGSNTGGVRNTSVDTVFPFSLNAIRKLLTLLKWENNIGTTKGKSSRALNV